MSLRGQEIREEKRRKKKNGLNENVKETLKAYEEYRICYCFCAKIKGATPGEKHWCNKGSLFQGG